MITIKYPERHPKLKEEDNKELIFCIVRKRWVALNPEEWVRQNFLIFLTDALQYPASLLAVEKQLILGELRKRFDIVVYGRDSNPFMVIECKEMNVPLSESVYLQALRYNTNLQADYLVITNGTHCMCFKREGNTFLPVHNFPAYKA